MKFEILHLLYFTAVVCAAISMLHWYAGFWIAAVCIVWLSYTVSKSIRESESKELNMPPIAVAGLFVVVAGAAILFNEVLISPVRFIEDDYYRQRRINFVCNALDSYMADKGNYPAPTTFSENGEPEHSWRTQILPYLGENQLYQKYNFGLPWDRPANSALLNQLNSNCALLTSRQGRREFKTPFKLVTGPGTPFEGEKLTNPHALRHGDSRQILIIEDNTNPVPWMQPDDLTIEDVRQLFDSDNANNGFVNETILFRRIRYDFLIATYDGQYHRVGYLDDPNEIVPFFQLDSPRIKSIPELPFEFPETQLQPKLSGFFFLSVNFMLAILPAFWQRLRIMT